MCVVWSSVRSFGAVPGGFRDVALNVSTFSARSGHFGEGSAAFDTILCRDRVFARARLTFVLLCVFPPLIWAMCRFWQWKACTFFSWFVLGLFFVLTQFLSNHKMKSHQMPKAICGCSRVELGQGVGLGQIG